MIPIETQIFRLIFPPVGAIPLEKIEAVPHIRQHINSIIDLASTEHGISSPNESAALTARVIELRDTPGPDGKIRTWRTIAEICGTTLDAVRHRYGKGKATIRKSRTVEDAALSGYDIKDKLAEFIKGQTAEVDRFAGLLTEPAGPIQAINEAFTTVQELVGDVVPDTEGTDIPKALDSDAFNVAHLSTSGEFATIREIGLAGKPLDAVGAGVLEERSGVRTVEKPAPLDPETLTEVDRMLGEGMGVLDIAAELEMKGKHVPWTKIRARAAYLGRMKSKVKPEPKKDNEPEPAAEEPQVAEATDDHPEPVSISRKELDLRIWDMWRAGKTLDEISDILYSEGLYYSPKSVRVRLLSQGAKL
jgi:hypothetical protein